MNRRDFFKFASAAGLCVVSSKASAEGGMDDDYGPFFVQVQAAGGWDPTMLCDPKGSPVNTSFNNDIKTLGGIRYANVGPEWATFFETNAHRMVVLNGVDVQSNNHDAGRRNMASGRLGEGHPNLAAMVAGYQAPHLPLSFLSFGGYEETSGLVAPTRQVDRARLAGIIYPDRVSPDDAKSPLYHSETARSLIALARRKRAEALAQRAGLPKIKQSMDTLLAARLGSDQLQRLEELLPTLNGQGDQARVELAVAAYRAGVGTAANFARGGFDTHSNHNAAHRNAMAALLNLVNMLWAKVDEAGIAQRTVMLITSDFGRTPRYGNNTGYNANAGKDHWPISSMIVISELPGFEGGRTLGLTDEWHSAISLDPQTLEPAQGGVRIRPEHVHRNLRDLLGMKDGAIDKRFPLSPEHDLKLF